MGHDKVKGLTQRDQPLNLWFTDPKIPLRPKNDIKIAKTTLKCLENGGKRTLKGLNLCFNIMNVKLCLLNQEFSAHFAVDFNIIVPNKLKQATYKPISPHYPPRQAGRIMRWNRLIARLLPPICPTPSRPWDRKAHFALLRCVGSYLAYSPSLGKILGFQPG